MQLHLKIPPSNVFFFQTNAMFFPFLSAFNVVYQDQSENNVGEDDMIDVSIL